MSNLQFVAALVSAMAWPFFWLVVLLCFRKPLLALIKSVSKISHGDTAVEFDKEIKEVGAALVTESVVDQSQLPTGARASENVSRILFAWLEVETALRERLKSNGIDADNMPPGKLLLVATGKGVVTGELAKSLQGLKSLRNIAVHGQETAISDARVNEFVALSSAVKTAIMNLPVSQQTAPAIAGQGELATMNYGDLKKRLEADFPALRT